MPVWFIEQQHEEDFFNFIEYWSNYGTQLKIRMFENFTIHNGIFQK